MFFKKVIFLSVIFYGIKSFASVNIAVDNLNSFVCEFYLENYSVKSSVIDNKEISIIDFAESEEYASDKNGFRIPYKSFTIAVPQNGDANVYIEPLETRVIKLKGELLKHTDSSRVMTHKGLWSTVESYITLRNMRALRFFITPFSYNPHNHTLTILLKAKITVQFPPGMKSLSRNIKKYGDYEQMMRNLVLNYKNAQGFRRDESLVSRSVSPLSYSGKMLSFTVSDGVAGFNETSDKENGIMKITASDLSSVFGSSIPISSIAVYSANQEELSLKVPEVNSIPTGIEEVPVLRVDVNGNTFFDGSDYLLFYVSSLSDWVTSKGLSGNKIKFNLNRVAQARTYWIKDFGGTKNITKFYIDGTVANDTLRSFWKRIRYREVTRYLSGNGAKAETEGGIDWVWDRLTEGNRLLSFDAELNFPEINRSYPGYLSIGKGFHNSDTLLFKLAGNSIELNNRLFGIISTWPDSNLSNRSHFDLTMTSNTPKDYAFFELDYIDLTYNTPLSMKYNSKFRILTDTIPGIKTYGINHLNLGKNFIFRLEDNGKTVSLIDSVTKVNSDSQYYYWTDSTGIGIQYFISNDNEFLSLPEDYEIHNYQNNNLYEKKILRGVSANCDYLIITSDNFLSQAIDLASHKVNESIFSNPIIVNIKDIYREFSGGTPDYSAIRNFLSYIHNGGWSSAPDYVLLLGSGHYDYKNYSRKGDKNCIPTCQYGDFCVEDYYSYLDHGDFISNSIPDIFLGRIVALTSGEASSAVSKIIEMESKNADYSDWRNRILLVADDDRIPVEEKKFKDGITHYLSSEKTGKLAQFKRPSLSVRKVYLFEYPWNDIWKKPGAFNALKGEINNGVSCVNYYGHGSWKAWADEDILNKDNIKSLSNVGRYPIFTAFSCRVGRFDIPGETSLAGDMVNQEKSGAIVFIASTRTASASTNTLMGNGLYWALYDKENNYSIGQAYTASKIQISIISDTANSKTTVGSNLKRYALIGDPSFRINRSLDSIKVKIVSEKIDTIQALETITIKGEIGKFDSTASAINSSFGIEGNDPAYAQIGFYFPDRDSVKRKDGGKENSVTYSLPGDYLRPDTIVPVINGRFSATILMPKRVPFNMEKPILRIYSWNEKGTKSAMAIKDDFIFYGSKSGSIADNSGPSISIRPVRLDSTGNVSSKWNVPVSIGDTITATLPMILNIGLWDESGLLLTGNTPGEGLTIEIEGISEQVSIGNEFSMDPKSNGTAGSIEYFIDSAGVLVGCYNVIVGAMDVNGNISRKEVVLKVTSSKEFNLTNVYNFPNPAVFGKSTRFYFDHNRMVEEIGQNIDATIRIYSLSGKLLKIFRHASNGEQWNLTDQLGHRLSPNVYLYTITAKMHMDSGYTEKEKKIRSNIKKLVIYPPR